ncbi:MAG TPA: extracellular solute-binding protein [Cellvibrionaceae bacterium]
MLIRQTGLRFLLLAAALAALNPIFAQEVNLYTTREPGLVQPLLDAFSEQSGIKVNTVFMKDGLSERVASEGERSPADVLMAVDFGNLTELAENGVTQAANSDLLNAAVPEQLRDSEGHWFALSMRARLIYASTDLTDIDGLHYEDLAKPEWKNRVCMRSGQHPYNTALVAHMIAHHGEAYTETWLKGVKDNLARRAGGGDRQVARDILGGLCDIGIGNSYYVGLMRSGDSGAEQKQWGDGIQIVLPRFEDGGTHVNVSGAAIARHAPNRENAVKLLEYLVSTEAQTLYARANYEYPVLKGASADPIIAAFGPLSVDPLPLAEISAHRRTASLLVDRVGFDN